MRIKKGSTEVETYNTCNCAMCRPNNVEEFAGELLETDNLELDINEETLAILAVAQMQISKGLTAEDLIKRLLTEPS